jgi:TrmH family RNA methyltransferase
MLSKTHLKYIQSLHLKKNRDAAKVFIAEGNKVVAELLRANKFLCKEIWASQHWIDNNYKTLNDVHQQMTQSISGEELKKISMLQSPSEVGAIFDCAEKMSVDPSNTVTLLLDAIQDPGNLGTIIRIADWFGVSNIVCSLGCADFYNPKVIQSSMGSISRVNVIYEDGAEWLTRYPNIPRYAATLHGENLNATNASKSFILMIGNESRGLSAEFLQMASHQITIPRLGDAESLNAAVATGIILSHLISH